VLRGVSLTVQRGEVAVVVGPSGGGKSTLLRCINGLERIQAGDIVVDGMSVRDPRTDLKKLRSEVGMVFQSFNLYPHMTALRNITLAPMKVRGLSRAQAEATAHELLRKVGIPEKAASYPAELSGGQQQRVAIARSLVLEPSLLLFDEPLSNLDLKLRIQMRYELRLLQRRLGKTAVYVTHDQTEALALSDRIAVLSQGRIEQIGTPSEIYERPASAFVADFIGSSNVLQARVRGDDGPADTAVETEHGLLLTIPRIPDVAGATVTLMLRPERFQMAGLSNGNAARANRFTASVRDVTYLGEDLHLRVLASDRQPLLVSIKNSKGTRVIASGTAIDLAIDPEDIHVLRR